MALQLGPVIGQIGRAEMIEPTFTPNASSGRATLATQVVGTGQWLVAVQIVRAAFNTPALWINNSKTHGAGGIGSSESTTSVVVGPGTIKVEGTFISSGHVHIIRIG